MTGNTRLAKLQMIRENDRRRMDDGAEQYLRSYMTPERERRMEHEPPYSAAGMRRVGFDEPDYREGAQMRRRRRRDGTYMHYGSDDREMEPIRFGGMVAMDSGRHRPHEQMTKETAMEWVEGMESLDPAKPHGGKWTVEQIKPIAQKYGVPTEGEKFWDFFAVMNALYSDYYGVAKKYNVLNPEFFADMSMAFINDKDAVENKALMYYECIVER